MTPKISHLYSVVEQDVVKRVPMMHNSSTNVSVSQAKWFEIEKRLLNCYASSELVSYYFVVKIISSCKCDSIVRENCS